jgi:hypothetical protein
MAFLVARVYNSGTATTHFFEYDLDTKVMSTYTTPNVFETFIYPQGAFLTQKCNGQDLEKFYYQSGAEVYDPIVTYTTTTDDPVCCTLNSSQFQVAKTNNTSLSTPDGTITVTSNTLDITLFQASINGVDYVNAADAAISFGSLPAGTYNITIKSIDGVCFVTSQAIIEDNISYPPLIIEETVSPVDFCPVFYPIEYRFELVNSTSWVFWDGQAYLTAANDDIRDFLATKPIIKILNNVNYGGVHQVVGVDDVNNPTKFYLDITEYVSTDFISFVPFGKQIFNLYGEKNFNVFAKIADIAISPDSNGVYIVRVEGFLQSLFQVGQPAMSDDLNLGRKFYLQPASFDLLNPVTVRTCVYSAVPSVVQYNEDLTPLGPAPINFINAQTQKGYPVLFSVLNDNIKRVSNVFSSNETEITTNASVIFFSALPGNSYDIYWISPELITLLTSDTVLPPWITVVSTDGGTIHINIDTAQGQIDTTDYLNADYNDDYTGLTINNLVGCYEFDFFNSGNPLFTLSLCVYPAQGIAGVCKKGFQNDPFNIAWINRQGGWSSYVFEGKKEIRRKQGKETTFKRGRELKKASIEEVYTEVNVSFAGKTIRELLFIDTLRTSIQAYLYNDSTKAWDIPIVIDKEDYTIHSLPHKQSEQSDSLTFLYSEDILIQKQ